MGKRDQYNSSGCLDMTAYLAIRNIERQKKMKSSQKVGMVNSKSYLGNNEKERRKQEG
jgi:hypothetical protein